MTEIVALPIAASTIGFPSVPGCTNACASAPAPARIPPESAIELAVVFAVPSAVSETPPPVTGASSRARVAPSQTASEWLLPMAKKPPPVRPSVVAFGAVNEAARSERTPSPAATVAVAGT